MRDNASYNVLVVGEDMFAASLLEKLVDLKHIQVRGLVWTGNPGSEPKTKVPLMKMEEIATSYDVDAILNLSPRQTVLDEINQNNPLGKALQDRRLAELFAVIGEEHSHMRTEVLKSKQTREELNTVLNSAQEAIQVADRNGILTYMNKAYTEVTGILVSDRLGKNVLEISPEGALAEVIRTKKSVFGKTMLTVSGVDVMCNASPIIVDGEMTGAVVIFRDISDIKKLARVLDMNKEELNNLKSGLSDLAAAPHTFDSFIGRSPEIMKCLNLAKKVALNSTTVLITGESGTGKEVLAQAIHNYGPRANKPFIGINCAAIPDGLLESELFGHEKGAFTGATSVRIGKFELADKGSIFLDEIGEMDIMLQSKILRVLQEREIERIGGIKSKQIDIKVIAATNINLLEAVHKGTFRHDLYYRINVIPLHLAPLRERGEDVVLLAEDILRRKNRRYNKNCVLEPALARKLMNYNWPGNVRELENVLERAVLLAEGPNISSEMLTNFLNAGQSVNSAPLLCSLVETEKIMIEHALMLYGTDMVGKTKTAKVLDISLSTLYNKMEKYRISKNYK